MSLPTREILEYFDYYSAHPLRSMEVVRAMRCEMEYELSSSTTTLLHLLLLKLITPKNDFFPKRCTPSSPIFIRDDFTYTISGLWFRHQLTETTRIYATEKDPVPMYEMQTSFHKTFLSRKRDIIKLVAQEPEKNHFGVFIRKDCQAHFSKFTGYDMLE
jgi:hypothetical protein